jgi:aminocarboxymuconate-semialdehyde decarboxylase
MASNDPPRAQHPEQRFRTDPSTWIKDGQGRRLRTVDMHAHVLTAAVETLVAPYAEKKAEAGIRLRTQGTASVEYNSQVMLPQSAAALTDLTVRFADMDRMGVDIQVISPLPTQYYYWADRDLAPDIVRRTSISPASAPNTLSVW